ncbi:MAG: NPCBM/NEW2 domain-containing protein, partial [Limisphaerales bacterium]
MRPIFLIALLQFVVLPAAFGWGQGHRKIREWAVARLPEWQREWIGAENLKRLCVDYKSLQDMNAGGKNPHLDPYCKVPGVRLSLHDVNGAEVSGKANLWYLERISDCLNRGEIDEAMKFLGVLCHWNEDPGCPSAHSSPISEAELKILIPPPADKARYNYLFGAGGIADVGQYDIPETKYHPRLLGRTRNEVALRIYQHQRWLERGAAARIVPLVQDMMQGDGSKAAALRAAAAADNARHVCDVIHTVLCLAKQRFEGGRSLPSEQPLSAWLPNPMGRRAPHPYYVTGFLVNQAMDAKRKLHPLAAIQGFGTGAPFRIGYTLAPNVFRQFRTTVGFHGTAGEKAAVAFEVYANGKRLHRTKFMRSGEETVDIEVDLPEVPQLKLELVTVAENPADSLHNLVVWGDPVL